MFKNVKKKTKIVKSIEEVSKTFFMLLQVFNLTDCGEVIYFNDTKFQIILNRIIISQMYKI